jgi:hypothetical protein
VRDLASKPLGRPAKPALSVMLLGVRRLGRTLSACI